MEHLVIKDFLIKPSFLLFWKSHEKQVFFYIHTALTASKASGNSMYLFQPMTGKASSEWLH